MNETVLIHFSGRNQPGLIAALSEVLAEYSACVLDIGQAVVHETLVLGLLIEVRPDNLVGLQDALAAKSGELRLQVSFTPVSKAELEHWIRSQGKDRFIITVLGRAISAHHLARVSAIIAEHGLDVDSIERLSGRLSLAVHTSTSNACVELRASGTATSEASMRAAFLATAHDLRIDIAFQRESIFRRNRRLFAFDMDSTLIQGEVIDELAKMAGVADKVVAITESAMRGEIEFQESFRRRVGLLRGLREERVRELLGTIPLVEGAEQLIGTLKMLGYKTAILSGGFTFFARHLQERLGIDYVFANDLDVVDGVVSGEVRTEIVDGARKAALLREIARKENISLEQVVAVGDGANDLPMLGIAGMGIAFRAKPIVRQTAGHAVSFLGLDSLLYLIGVRERDLNLPVKRG
ncbi:phosphoserine phosphatase SerB [Edaphobacter aggregans]|uniref:phosphoserine phosphatase SerB n=1 Tax=Edaphobacter aggregans TaxID=570835 RepID=UPI00054FDAC5|nr:phosphoserine phosphatase SerB [Edaphobacter aggregans]